MEPMKKLRNRAKIMICAFAAYLIFASQILSATTFFVSTTGNNTNSGTLAEPFRTITLGISRMVAGDILYVRAGVYNEVVSISKNGTEANPIIISGYYDGTNYEMPVIDGGSSLPASSWSGLMNVTGSYINVSWFEIQNSSINGYGLLIEAPGRYVKASFLKVHNNGQTGIMAKADNCIVEDCEVYLNCMSNAAHAAGSGWGNGIGFAREESNGITEYGVVRRCKVYDNHGEGIDAFEASHVTIEDCEVFNNWTQNVYVSDATFIVVQRNLVYNTFNPLIPPRNGLQTGISLFEERAGLPCYANAAFTTPYSTDNIIINNLLYNAYIGVLTWNEPAVVNPGFRNGLIANNTIVNGKLTIGNLNHVNSQIRNNIIYGASSIPTKVGLTFSNNCWKTAPPANGAGPGDVIGDPMVAKTGPVTADALTPDYFKLLPTSPAINKAMILTEVTEDFFRAVRDTLPDIGAIEYPYPLAISPQQQDLFKLFPNPATENLTIELPAFKSAEPVQIFNSTGALAKEFYLSQPNQQIDVEDLQVGIYFVSLKKNRDLSVKFIKK
jgi:hypothetical protein